jgi:outer membrane protein
VKRTYYQYFNKLQMKKLSLIVFGGLLAIGTLSCDKAENKGTAATSSTTTKGDAGKKTVYVNTDSLLANYQFYKDAQKEFENKGYRLQVDLGQRERGLQGELQAIQQRAQTMTQAELQGADIMLKKKGAELQQYSQQRQQALANEQAKKNARIVR